MRIDLILAAIPLLAALLGAFAWIAFHQTRREVGPLAHMRDPVPQTLLPQALQQWSIATNPRALRPLHPVLLA